MNNPPLSALILGDTAPVEFQPVLDRIHRHVATGSRRAATDLKTSRQMMGSDWFPDMVIALQAWPDQFSVREVEELISLCPLARILCCFGPWCDSDGRTRSIWPLGVRVSAAGFASRFEHEVALLANCRDVGSLLKNGDWLRPADRNPEQSACGEVPVPLFQQAAVKLLPLTASRTEIFEFDFDRPATSPLKNGDWLRPEGSNSKSSSCGEVPVPLFQQQEISVVSPDRRFREMLTFAFKTAGIAAGESQDTGQPASIIFDSDPWDEDRATALATIAASHPCSRLVACVGFPRPHIEAELLHAGADSVWFKLSPLADLIKALEFRL